MVLTIEQRIFLIEQYIKSGNSYEHCTQHFRDRYGHTPSRATIAKWVKKWKDTGSIRTAKRVRRRSVLNPNKMNEIRESLTRSPRKSLRRLSHQTQVSLYSTWKATKLLHFKPYKITAVQQLQPLDHEKRITYCNWFFQHVADGILDPQLLFVTDEAWFHLNGYVNSQNNRYWATENPHETFQMPLHDIKVGVWCAISARRIITIFFDDTINSNRYVTNILTPFFDQLTEEEKLYSYFQQDGATAHTAEKSLNRLEQLFEDRVVSKGIWPPRSPDLSPCDYFLWGHVKDHVYRNNPQSREELKNNIRDFIGNIPRDTLQSVFQNIFKRYQLCLQTGGLHFEHLL